MRANRELIEANRALTAEERADLLDEESGDYATANEFSDEEENAEADKEEEADQAGTPISQDPMPKEWAERKIEGFMKKKFVDIFQKFLKSYSICLNFSPSLHRPCSQKEISYLALKKKKFPHSIHIL